MNKFMRFVPGAPPSPTRGECAGCISCCVSFPVMIPRADTYGHPCQYLTERKPVGEPCPWVGRLESNLLGCRIHDHERRPATCDAYFCAEHGPSGTLEHYLEKHR